jgi:hypothetical protein
MAGEALIASVVIPTADDGSDGDQLVHVASDPRQQLANLDSRHARLDRIEFAADLGRSIRLDLIHVLVRRASAHVDHDDGLVLPS